MYSCKISNRERVLRGFREKIEKSIDNMDRQNGGKETCLSNMIQALSLSMGLPDETRDRLLLLARYHRMGALPLTVRDCKDRSENGALPEIEAGVRLALRWPDLAPIAPLLYSLAERWDGQGGPAKLRGEDIPVESRIFVPLLLLSEVSGAHKGVESAIASAFRKIEVRSGTSYDSRIVEEILKARQFLSPFIGIDPSVTFEGSSNRCS